MVKKGIGTVILRQGAYSDGQKWYTITSHDIETSIRGADAMNRTFKSYLSSGWTVKPPKEEKVAAPRKPQKEYPDGFVWNAEQYYRIAQENGFTFCDARGNIHVLKKYRDTIYEMMAHENQING